MKTGPVGLVLANNSHESKVGATPRPEKSISRDLRPAINRIKFGPALAILFIASFGCNHQEPPTRDRGAALSTALELQIPEPDSTSLQLFLETMEFARENNLHERPLGEIMTTVGRRFLTKPYFRQIQFRETDEAKVPGEEKLICRLDAFDCVSFVETALAMARSIKQGDYDYGSWASNVRDLRYRGGKIQGYCSRLHYFSEWILDNEKRGTVENITREIGGVPFDKELTWITDHRERYARLMGSDSLFACIGEMEERLKNLEKYYVPQDRIRDTYDQLQAGDILAFATRYKGLDVTHTGLVYDNGDGTKGVLHSWPSEGVQVSPDIQAYVQSVDAQIGIFVVRPQDRSI